MKSQEEGEVNGSSSSSQARAAVHVRSNPHPHRQRFISVFSLPTHFFDSSILLSQTFADKSDDSYPSDLKKKENDKEDDDCEPFDEKKGKVLSGKRWSCNICKEEFESLQDQRSHFKSDFHRFNVKLSVSGKDVIKEEEFNVLTNESLFEDYDISSTSGSEDEVDKESCLNKDGLGKVRGGSKQKLFIRLQTRDVVSVWKCLLLEESEDRYFVNNKLLPREDKFIERLQCLIHEPRDKTHLRIVLLASGGHFAGCVFDGNTVLAHKTFHRYVVRAKAGRKQSSKDATGKAANSAGASLRRYNELALKKEIQELLAAWKPYFDACSCVFIYAPSNNRQLFFDGEKSHFSNHNCVVCHIPFLVRRPTLNEARRVYDHLTNLVYEVDEKGCPSSVDADSLISANDACQNHHELKKEPCSDSLEHIEAPVARSGLKKIELSTSNENEVIGTSLRADEHTPLHEAAKCGDAQRTLELLEQGLDPCIKDSRGRTPYMSATEKEVRNTFRRFMALNLEKWDWHAANVPSPLTKEMEESQAAKQAEKDAKRKAKAKELKKSRKVKEKAQAQAALSRDEDSSAAQQGQWVAQASANKGQPHSTGGSYLTKEEELSRAQAAEREKRAAAAERRIAASKAIETNTPTSSATNLNKTTEGSDQKCSCCLASLAGKIPFHRYHYKYCSTSCMHVHREMLEDG